MIYNRRRPRRVGHLLTIRPTIDCITGLFVLSFWFLRVAFFNLAEGHSEEKVVNHQAQLPGDIWSFSGNTTLTTCRLASAFLKLDADISFQITVAISEFIPDRARIV